MDKKILITGGCGYVGSRLALTLAESGFQIRIVDIASPEERHLIFPENFEIITCDLRDKDCVKKSIRDVNFIVHLAADIGSMGYMKEHQAEILANNMAIDSLIYPETARAGAKTILYSSSSMVFQHALSYPYKESDLPKTPPPTNVYGLAKLAGEYFCRSFYNQYDLKFIIVRYHNIYGPGEDSKGTTPADIHVLPALVDKVISGQYPLELIGGLGASRPFTYVDDAVSATKMILEKAIANDPNVINNDFNIGPSEATRILDLATLIWKLLGDGREFKYVVKNGESDTAVRREMDATKIETIIGWKPTAKLEDGILKTAEWIKNRKKK